MSIFDFDRIQSETQLRQVEYRSELESTNSLALKLTKDLEDARPALVLTERQTAGRGRGSNSWVSEPGALAFSLVLDASVIPVADRSLSSIATGVAVRNVLAEVLANAANDGPNSPWTVSVKWPNDILIDHKKVCGILTELQSDSAQTSLIVGIGVNVNNTLEALPTDLQSAATSLFNVSGQQCDLTSLLIDLANRIQNSIGKLIANRAFIIEQANRHHALSGTDVTVEAGEDVVSGRCVEIDESGRLMLMTPDGVRPVIAGSITDWRLPAGR